MTKYDLAQVKAAIQEALLDVGFLRKLSQAMLDVPLDNGPGLFGTPVTVKREGEG